MSDNTLIAPTMGVGLGTFSIDEDSRVTLSASELAGIEVVALEIGQGDPLVYEPTGLELAVGATALSVLGPGRYRANKPTTAGSVGVFLDGGSTLNQA